MLEGPQGKFVYVVNAESKAEPRPVEVGEWSGDAWIIVSGLKGGERVIVDGVMRIGPGAPVRVAEPGAGDAGKGGGAPAKQAGKDAGKEAGKAAGAQAGKSS